MLFRSTEKALRGGYQARPPLGYRIETKKEPPVVVPEEAKIVRSVFDMYVNQHKGFFDIARELNRLGCKTSHGKVFERRSIEYIIQNPTYCGMIRWNRTTNETNVIKPKDEWIITEGNHEAIISKELFEQAQKRFESEYRPRGARPSSTYRHWLSGLMKCPACGRTMTAKHTAGYCYFTCYGYSKGKCLAKQSISSRIIEKSVLQSISEVLADSNLSFRLVKQESKEEINRESLILDQLSRIAGKERRIRDAYRDGIDTLEEYKENKAILVKEQETLEAELEQLRSVSPKEDDPTSAMLARVSSVYEILMSDADDTLKNEMLKTIVEKIVYDKNTDTLKVYYFYNP